MNPDIVTTLAGNHIGNFGTIHSQNGFIQYI